MTFADAAIAYELLQSGLSRRFVAPFFGVSHTHLANVIKCCLENGKDGRYIDAVRGNRPAHYKKKTLAKVRLMRFDKIPYKEIARKLRTDPEKLQRAYIHYDRQTTK